MNKYSGEAPVVGARVISADRELLGTVAEVAADRFKINAPVQMDYWLMKDTITGTPGGQIQVSFRKNDQDEYKVLGPNGRDNPRREGLIL